VTSGDAPARRPGRRKTAAPTDEIRFETVPARLVEEHSTGAPLEHHRHLPLGAGALSLDSARARRCGDVLRRCSSKYSKPTVNPGASMPVCMPVSPTATQFTMKRVRT
jgi:hypothetical protein